MSALGTLAAGAVGGIWKIAAILLLALLLVVGAGAGGGWWLAAHDRDQAETQLALERLRTAELATSIREQNRAVDALATAKREADARGLAAQQIAAATGRRYDGALARIAGNKATTCADAMPAVNQLLEGVR